MQNKIINILGQSYNLEYLTNAECERFKILDCNGLFEAYSKRLLINKDVLIPDPQKYEKIENYLEKVVRHEILHAFFYEAGLNHYCEDEKLVDFLAITFYKLIDVMNQADVLKNKG